ncbi:hypothetical protein ASD15_09090 [Massilia sp. Root351]|uniref:DUF1302 domain-containing protein n=1 Tax=Massilia sp. Root351 TaxID=1736522 RepID=UPI00070BB205|nr:DUF1302 domain-containing protein [Massilia sp. Root351]KQV82207.1 hypothetical protein ASD15_09090 [Massilia sp. Root351]
MTKAQHPVAKTALAAALCAIGAIGGVRAGELETGNPDLAMRWDNTVKYNYGHRLNSQEGAILKSANYDDGDRNFNKGTVSSRVDLLSEFDVVYQRRMGLRVSAAGWYDRAYRRLDNTNPASSNHLENGKPAVGLSRYARRYHGGASGEVLDAFVFAGFDAGDMPVNLKLGRHTLFWGESLSSPVHGISFGQSPVDFIKAYSVPGSDAKELFLPRAAASVQMSPSTQLSLAAQYFLDWKPARMPESGSFLGFFDYAFQGAESFNLGPLGPAAQRQGDSEPKKSGDWGVSARWSPAWLDGTVGVYARRTSDMLPQANLRLAGLPAALFGPSGAALCTAAIPGAAVAGGNCLFYPAALGATSRYQLEYANGIGVYGLSLSKSVAGVSLGADLSYRTGMPLYSTPALLMPVGTSPAILAALNAKVGGAVVVAAGALPQRGEASGARGNTWHGALNLIGTMAQTPLSDALTWNAEMVWSRLGSISQGAAFYRGRASYTGIDKPGKDYVGLTVNVSPTWFQVLPGLDLSMPLSYGRGLSGNSQVQAGGNKDAGSLSVGLAFDLRQKYRFDIKYVDFFGPVATDPASGAITSNAGVTALLRDRGFLAATFKTTF